MPAIHAAPADCTLTCFLTLSSIPPPLRLEPLPEGGLRERRDEGKEDRKLARRGRAREERTGSTLCSQEGQEVEREQGDMSCTVEGEEEREGKGVEQHCQERKEAQTKGPRQNEEGEEGKEGRCSRRIHAPYPGGAAADAGGAAPALDLLSANLLPLRPTAGRTNAVDGFLP